MELHATHCAICQTEDNATVLYPANFDGRAFNQATFSARRLPDRIHYRMVKCNTCRLVRSDPIADPEALAQLYARSHLTYADEIADLKLTYGRYLAKLADYGVKQEALLEIGCGNGFLLEEALAQGYATVKGVEPSVAAIAAASPKVRPHLVCDIMRPGLFPPETFDVICLFQVFDHVPDPGALLDECARLLKPGGLMLGINHNIEAISARLLGDRSPIVDIEHTFLYSPTTMARLFREYRLRVRDVGSVVNTYPVFYLVWLTPLPAFLKRWLLRFLKATPLARLRVCVPLGNLYLIAEKPA